MTTRKSRGSYASLICLRCRARKIKCVLPEGTVQPSDQPLPQDRACHRCRQNGFDCIVDSTTLGRPACKRQRVTLPQGYGGLAAPAEPTGMDDFLLSQPWELEKAASSSHAITGEVCEALFSPMHLLYALLSRSGAFASALPVAVPLSKLTPPIELIDAGLAELLDQHLVWHRVYFPYTPSLATLRQRATPKDRSSMPSLLLFAILCDLALDVPSKRLDPHRWLQPSLQSIVFHYGQAVMFFPPNHRDAITALELIAEYRPLSLVSSKYAAPSAITGGLYIAAAKRICQRLDLDTTAQDLRAKLDASGIDLGDNIMDILQWLHVMAVEVEGTMPNRHTPLMTFLSPEVEEILSILREAAVAGKVPWQGYFLLHHLTAAQRFFRTMCDVVDQWQDLDMLASIIENSVIACQQQRAEFSTGLQTPLDNRQAAEAGVVTTLLDSELHKLHSGVVATSLFYAVMSGVYTRPQAEFQPEELANAGNHVIDRLKAQPESDPDRHPIRKFLEKYGESRMDELERLFTNFVGLAEGTKLHGIPFVARTRHVASELLFACKDVVENNAARLKGWGGFHDRVDTQLILFQVCARRLEEMTEPSEREDAISQGNLLSASAMLIRSLHSIMSGWKKKLAENQWRGITSLTPSEMAKSSRPVSTTTGSSDTTDVMWTPSTDAGGEMVPTDFFADWSSWPQIETLDFVEFLQADLDQGLGWFTA